MVIRRPVLWILAFGLFAALAVPITISFDGLLYMQSSQAIFTSAALDGYQWTRGPLYPLIIRAVRLAGGTGSVWLVGTQAVAAAVGAWTVTRAVLGRGWARWLALALVLLNPLTLGYAGSVLQQTWITLVLALGTGIIWAAMDGRASRRGLVIALVTLTILATFLISQLAYVCAGSAAVVAWVWRPRADREDPDASPQPRSVARRTFGRAALAGLAFVAVVVLARGIQVPWNLYERSVVQGAETNAAGIPLDIPEPSPLDLIVEAPDRLPEIADTASVILDVPLPGAVSTWGGDENDFFGFQPFSPVRRCGIVQYNDQIQVASEATAALVSATCVSKGLHMAVGALVPVGHRLHQVASVAFVLALVLLPWFRRGRRTLLLLVPFYLYWAMYSVYGASLDRYGFPLYLASATLLVFMLQEVVLRVRRRGAPATSPLGDGSDPVEGPPPTSVPMPVSQRGALD